MTGLAVAHDVLRRLIQAAPVAWRQDRIFRIAAIGAGLTAALVLVRVFGPQAPSLPPTPSERNATEVPALSAPGQTPSLGPARTTVPKIVPGHPLNDAIIVPAPDGDRFGVAPSIHK